MKARVSGVSLWELSFSVVLAALLAGTVVLSSWKMTEQGRGRRTLDDMSAVLEACRQYDALHGYWPSAFSALHEVLPQAEDRNVWGEPFVIASGMDRVWVETDVPAGVLGPSLKGAYVVVRGVSGKDRVRLSANRRLGAAARLVYEQRNVYDP